jgi:hypothetical protein
MVWDNSKSNFETRDDVPDDKKITAAEWNNMVSDQKSRITGIDVEDDGTLVLETTTVNFATNLTVTDDGDGSVTIDATDTNLTDEEVEDIVGALVTGGTNVSVNYDDPNDTLTIDATDTRTDVRGDGALKASNVEDINFTTNLGVLDEGDGSVQVAVSNRSISDNGTEVVQDFDDINFDSNIDVVSDGDGSVTVNASSSTDTTTDVSDDGTTVVSQVTDINFGDNVTVTNDGDGTVTVDAAASGGGTSDTTLGYNIDASQYDHIFENELDTRENELDARGSNLAFI